MTAQPNPARRNWRWYRSPESDRIVAKDEFEGLALHGQAALAEAIKRFKRGEERAGEVKKLKGCDGLWEIRVQVGRDPFRAVFFYDTAVIVVCVTAIYKNQQELPQVDKRRAMRRKAEWIAEGERRAE